MANRLAEEPSPYLQQHADNPVDWYPWGEEAFTRAREEDLPILLSIGYSSCHWCHVMERESFADPQVAKVLNQAFVPVKVDREERPDVDAIYMQALQALTGHGGWPLTAFLTPEGEPFHAGTYYPPEPRHGMPSFTDVLHRVSEVYRSRRDDVNRNATQLREMLERTSHGDPGEADGPEGPQPSGEVAEPGAAGEPEAMGDATLRGVAHALLTRLDPVHGGFGGAPKFPQPLVLDFLLRHHHRTGDTQSVRAVVHTLRRMARGGIHDHLAGGFHRYSVDEAWRVPHFEKMLYDNGLLAGVYLDAHRLTGDEEMGRTARRILDYLLADLRSPEGGFYSARDADSPDAAGEPREGAFYLWRPDEVDEALGAQDGELFRHCFDVTDEGNFEGDNILHLPHDLEAMARARGMSAGGLTEKLAELSQRLRQVRENREAPFRDEKVLSGWNGYVIRALAEAGAGLRDPEYTDRAREAAHFILDAMRRDDRLLRVWKDGTARIHGFLEDYASLGNALLTLHETTVEPVWLQEADWCAEKVVDLFHDEESGRFFDTPRDGEALVVRPRDPTDGATPSGQSLAVELLARLGTLRGEQRYIDLAQRTLRREASTIARVPMALGRLLATAAFLRTPPLELAVVGPRNDGAEALLGAFHGAYRPHRLVAGWDPATDEQAAVADVPILEGRTAIDGVATAYPCRLGTCRRPVTDSAELRHELRALEKGPGQDERLDEDAGAPRG